VGSAVGSGVGEGISVGSAVGVADGLSADRLTQKLYTGAVFLTQVALLAGIYDDQAGAPLMNFDGAYQFRGLAAVSYPNPERFLPSALTATGNYH